MAGKLDIPIIFTKKRVPFRLWGSITLIVLIVVGYFVFMNNWYDLFWPKQWGAVEVGHVYRCNKIYPHLTRKVLKSKGVRVVVNMEGLDPDDKFQRAEIDVCEDLGIELKRFPMKGNGIPGDPDLSAALDRYASALAAVVRARRDGKVVLIQCGAGRHRTGGITACYQMLIQGKSGPEAYAQLREYGWKPRKHQILPDWLNANMPEIVRRLVEMGVLDQAPDPLPYLGPEGAEPTRKDAAAVHAEAIR